MGHQKCMYFVSNLSLLSKTTCQNFQRMQWLGGYHEMYSTGLDIRSANLLFFLNDIFYFANECNMFNYVDVNYIYICKSQRVKAYPWCVRGSLKLCWNGSIRIICRKIQINRRAFYLTHWGRVTHICVNKLTIIGSYNGLSPGRRQAIIWTNAGILLIGPLGTNFNEILIKIHTFSFKKMHLKMSSE